MMSCSKRVPRINECPLVGRHVQLCLCLRGEGSGRDGGWGVVGYVYVCVCVGGVVEWGGGVAECRVCNWRGGACGFAACAAAQDLMWHVVCVPLFTERRIPTPPNPRPFHPPSAPPPPPTLQLFISHRIAACLLSFLSMRLFPAFITSPLGCVGCAGHAMIIHHRSTEVVPRVTEMLLMLKTQAV